MKIGTYTLDWKALGALIVTAAGAITVWAPQILPLVPVQYQKDFGLVVAIAAAIYGGQHPGTAVARKPV